MFGWENLMPESETNNYLQLTVLLASRGLAAATLTWYLKLRLKRDKWQKQQIQPS